MFDITMVTLGRFNKKNDSMNENDMRLQCVCSLSYNTQAEYDYTEKALLRSWTKIAKEETAKRKTEALNKL